MSAGAIRIAAAAHGQRGTPRCFSSGSSRPKSAAQMPPTISPKSRNSLIEADFAARSVKLEFLLPRIVGRELRLLRLGENKILDHQIIHFGAHEAAPGVGRRADDRLTAHIERGVDQDRASGN